MIRETCLRALRHFGPERQLRKAAEEAAEFSAAIIRYLDDPDGADHAAEECADMEIMCIQVREIVGSDRIDDWKIKKIRRLHQRLEIKERKEMSK